MKFAIIAVIMTLALVITNVEESQAGPVPAMELALRAETLAANPSMRLASEEDLR